MEYRSRVKKTSVISECGMLIRGVVKFSARNCPELTLGKLATMQSVRPSVRPDESREEVFSRKLA